MRKTTEEENQYSAGFSSLSFSSGNGLPSGLIKQISQEEKDDEKEDNARDVDKCCVGIIFLSPYHLFPEIC